MKRLKLAVIALFTLVTISSVSAQDENNPWAVGFGVNVVDFYNGSDFTDQVKDLLGNQDWNILPSISRISAEKYIEKGFSIQLAGSLNKIETIRAENDSDFLYWAVDAIVKYDLNNLIGETAWFDPFVYAGGGYTSLDSEGELMANVGVGFNAWLNNNLGLNFQTGTKIGFADNVGSHYQTALGLVVKFGGTDTDGDGVYDKNDACPEVAGLKEFNGCPDADGDGIKDSDDACPNVAGLAAMNGCPDSDGDGVADNDDMCPNAKGTKANKGCPDTDGDGTVDKDDKCVSVAGPSANAGCPWPDTDGDGVLDKDDKCPNEAGVASEMGCPEKVISNTAKMGVDTFAKAILFNSNRTSFKPGVTKQLDGMAQIMKEFPKANFLIKGYTDNTGAASYNLKLSERRANVVMKYLIKKGVDASRLESKGYGIESPIATNATRAGRAKNRRVEVKVTN
ncbi:OmpA family protein [Polaribacter sp. WD7]|uniref:OmpA family protein n=1 Tax=Polaribacter sp. WD7 TaxID=2269061 RepID=UPI000DF206EF|nr:OmpA family protein [Polaribacter sp. WD7]RCS27784.1 OmpA family protein [Polaribacter sp. WD7]